jgi:hypothetical protein
MVQDAAASTAATTSEAGAETWHDAKERASEAWDTVTGKVGRQAGRRAS